MVAGEFDTGTLGAATTALLRAMADGSDHGVMALQEQLGLNRRQFNNAARRLFLRSYATIVKPGVIRLTNGGKAAASSGEVIRGGPKGQVKIIKDTFRQRAWTAMRVRRCFTIGEIVADASRDGDGDQQDNARRYVSRLSAAGYVAEMPRRVSGTAPGSNGFKRWLIRQDTGPKAPVFRESACAIHDPNTGEDVACKTAS
ncbi:hypothetical protein [Acidimangrovimonas sediminis]|uniref:hypothetical protein n=1 Tax=Acidimangrovimonas sediminis TaxID=2056283 RepID=UPI0011AED2DD|nr:hypothetical protein [Acidimangrovimonas sediminis]